MRYLWLVFLLAGCMPGKNSDIDSSGLDLSGDQIKKFSSPLLLTYQGCQEVIHDLKQAALDEMYAHIEIKRQDVPIDEPDYGGCMGIPAMAPPGGSADMAVSESMPVEGVDFSGTNNQEKGVDEADVVKTDGKFFYLLSGREFKILKIKEEGQLELSSSIFLGNNADAKSF